LVFCQFLHENCHFFERIQNLIIEGYFHHENITNLILQKIPKNQNWRFFDTKFEKPKTKRDIKKIKNNPTSVGKN